MESSEALEQLMHAWIEVARRQKLLCIDYIEHIAGDEIGTARVVAISMATNAEEMHTMSAQMAPLVTKIR